MFFPLAENGTHMSISCVLTARTQSSFKPACNGGSLACTDDTCASSGSQAGAHSWL